MPDLDQRQGENSCLKLTTPVPLTRHPAEVYLSGLSQGSQPTMRHALDAIANLLTFGECSTLTLDWAKLRYEHTAAVRAALIQRFAPATAKKMLCALRRVLTEAKRLGLMGIEDYTQAVDLPRVDTPPKPLRGRALDSSEIAALMDVCLEDSRPIALRDVALIAILRGCGLRRCEVVNLELKDFNPSTNSIEVREGKRGAYRAVYLPSAAVPLVLEWLDIRGHEPGPLLCPVRKGGKIQMQHMSDDAVLKILRRRGKQAGVTAFSPHDFRRTFCSDLLDAGIDISTVQKLAGHSSPVTTAKYDRRGEETKRKAVQRLSIPSKHRTTK